MPEQVTVTCPKCGKEHQVHRSLIGQKAKCSCGNVFVVATGASKASCVHCGAEVYVTEAVCPACGQSTRERKPEKGPPASHPQGVSRQPPPGSEPPDEETQGIQPSLAETVRRVDNETAEQLRKGCSIGCAVLIALPVVIGLIATMLHESPVGGGTQQGDPASIARSVFGKTAQVESADGSSYVVRYRLSAHTVGFAKMQFCEGVQRLVPGIFNSNPSAQRVEVLAFGTFVDVRGNQSEGKAMHIAFTRGNAATIQWGNVLPLNLPKIADMYSEHADFRR